MDCDASAGGAQSTLFTLKLNLVLTLDEVLSSSPSKNPFRNYRVRDKQGQEQGGNDPGSILPTSLGDGFLK